MREPIWVAASELRIEDESKRDDKMRGGEQSKAHTKSFVVTKVDGESIRLEQPGSEGVTFLDVILASPRTQICVEMIRPECGSARSLTIELILWKEDGLSTYCG